VSETLESLRGSFNRSLRVEGKADRTVVLYGQSIDFFSRWLAEKGLSADLSNLTRDNVLHWLDALRAKGLTTGTVRTRWRGLRRFVNWLGRSSFAPDMLSEKVFVTPAAAKAASCCSSVCATVLTRVYPTREPALAARSELPCFTR
jgi:site-specific recombinase XerD